MGVKKYRSDICTVCKLILSLLWLSATRTLPSILVQTSALQSIDVSPNLCHYLWALCLIRLRRLVRWPPCYDTLQYPCEHCSLFIEQPFYTNDLPIPLLYGVHGHPAMIFYNTHVSNHSIPMPLLSGVVVWYFTFDNSQNQSEFKIMLTNTRLVLVVPFF